MRKPAHSRLHRAGLLCCQLMLLLPASATVLADALSPSAAGEFAVESRVASPEVSVGAVGSAALAAGETRLAAVTFADSELVHYVVAQATLDSLAAQGATEALSDGDTGFSDQAREALLESMVNTSGMVRATAIRRSRGKILLTGSPPQ